MRLRCLQTFSEPFERRRATSQQTVQQLLVPFLIIACVFNVDQLMYSETFSRQQLTNQILVSYKTPGNF